MIRHVYVCLSVYFYILYNLDLRPSANACMHTHVYSDTTLQSMHWRAHLSSYQQCTRILYPYHLVMPSFSISANPVELEVIQMPITGERERQNTAEVYNAIKCRYINTQLGKNFRNNVLSVKE